MADVFLLVQTGAAIVTAFAAIGVFAFVRRGYATLREHDRVLFGEDSVAGWNGIVPMVKNNRERVNKQRKDIDSLKRLENGEND